MGMDSSQIEPATGEPVVPVAVGQTYWFEYHCWESEESSDALLWHHTHQQALVVRELSWEQADCHMCEVVFPDGFQATVFRDELLDSRDQITRPAWKAPSAAAGGGALYGS